MTVNKLINDWCDEQNRKTRAFVWFYCVAGVCFTGAAGVWFFTTSWLVFLSALVAIVSIIIWFGWAPKVIAPEIFRGMLRNCRVDDSLLERIADSTEVPTLIKHDVAHQLQTNYTITYSDLFLIIDLFKRLEAANQVTDKPGFKKLAAYGDPAVLKTSSEPSSIEKRIAEAASDYKLALANEGFASEYGGIDKQRSELFKLVEEWEGEEEVDKK